LKENESDDIPAFMACELKPYCEPVLFSNDEQRSKDFITYAKICYNTILFTHVFTNNAPTYASLMIFFVNSLHQKN